MSLLRSGRLDAPLDYRVLWSHLRERMEELAADQATKAANAETDVEIRRHQGAYRFGYTLLSEMDRIQEEARKEYGPLRQMADDETA